MDSSDKSFILNVLDEGFSDWKASIEMWACIHALEIKPVKLSSGAWAFCYEDCIGKGNTIYDAARDFYNNLKKVV